MSYDYEALYATQPDALGGQARSLAQFLTKIAPAPCRILDVGCGQGRDALPLARAGHAVTGVDLSPSGVAAMVDAAKAEGLDVTGHVADIIDYMPDGPFDVVLVDRTLHMLDDASRAAAQLTLMAAAKDGGWLVIADETSNLPAMRAALEADARPWTIERCVKGELFAQASG
jgi:SAM-dependent methyltransferase